MEKTEQSKQEKEVRKRKEGKKERGKREKKKEKRKEERPKQAFQEKLERYAHSKVLSSRLTVMRLIICERNQILFFRRLSKKRKQ